MRNLELNYYEDAKVVTYFKETSGYIYFIKHGLVHVLDRAAQWQVVSYEAGGYFGDFQILLDLKSDFSYRTGNIGSTVLYKLKADKFLQLLELYPEQADFYKMRALHRYHHLKKVRN